MADRPAPLDGVRIVEWTDGLPASFAGFLLSGLGADVTRVETAGPAPSSGERVVLRGRRAARAANWETLVAAADVVLTDESVGAPRCRPDVIRCRVSGWDEAASGLPPDEALLAAALGIDATQW